MAPPVAPLKRKHTDEHRLAKKLRRAKSERSKSDDGGESHKDQPEEKKKSKKKDRKTRPTNDGIKIAELDISDSGYASGSKSAAAESSSQSPSLHPEVDGLSGYIEHADLSGRPQSEVDEFLSSNAIKIVDTSAKSVSHRPILAFTHLPTYETHKSTFSTFTSPTPIQSATWPHLFAERDVVGVAETGSGKTLAFGVPCVSRLSSLPPKARKRICAVIVSPTRELACQIYDQLAILAKQAGLKVACVYGGVSKDDQRVTIKKAQIIVATPGRLNDFLSEGAIELSAAGFVCLDEADRMLDRGFEEDIKKILQAVAPGPERQTVMFTATWPVSVRQLASSYMKDPVQVYIGNNPNGDLRANLRIEQSVEVMDPRSKDFRLVQLLRDEQKKSKKARILVFCLYKKEATRVETNLRNKGFNVAGIHGDLSQVKRTASLQSFKTGEVPILVATDVAARGLDIPAVRLVVNVTFPLTAEDYVHRIGRYVWFLLFTRDLPEDSTGRAGETGRAITFFTEHDKHLSGSYVGSCHGRTLLTCHSLIGVLKAANQPVPDELLKFGTTVKKKSHDSYGAFYKDVDMTQKSTRITFDD
jgi:ATP-dependent RNA helicase DBP3